MAAVAAAAATWDLNFCRSLSGRRRKVPLCFNLTDVGATTWGWSFRAIDVSSPFALASGSDHTYSAITLGAPAGWYLLDDQRKRVEKQQQTFLPCSETSRMTQYHICFSLPPNINHQHNTTTNYYYHSDG